MNVYIAGIGRSGSTFFSRYIANYENVFSSGEFFPSNIFSNPKMICSCGKTLSECEYYNFLFRQLTLDEVDFLKFKAEQLIDFKRIKNKFRFYPSPIFFDKIYDHIFNYNDAKYYSIIVDRLKIKTLEYYKKNIFIDASKQYYLLSLYLKGGSTLPKIVHLKRNPLGVFASNKRSRPQLNIRKFVESWKRSELCIYRLVKNYKLDYYGLDFERFTMNPIKEIGGLSDFFGMELGAFYKGEEQHVLGNSNVRKANELIVKTDDRFKIELEEREIEFIKKELSL